MENADLIILAKNSNKEAFGLLYKEYFNRIYRYCIVNLYRDDLAQDVAQETFLRAWKSLTRFSISSGSSFQAFLFTIARNLIIDLSRKKKEFSLETIKEITVEDKIEEKIDQDSKILSLKNALAKLPESDRQILILRYFQELSHNEIAHILKSNSGTIRVRTTRILRKLKSFF